jgi:thiol-disulfide isomerase/thioredoxin
MALIKASDTDFQSYLEQHPTVVVKFFATWCGTCKLMAPKFRKLADREEFSDVTFLDINAEENPQARKRAGVSNLPFFAVFRHGELVAADYTAKIEGVEQMIRENTKAAAS